MTKSALQIGTSTLGRKGTFYEKYLIDLCKKNGYVLDTEQKSDAENAFYFEYYEPPPNEDTEIDIVFPAYRRRFLDH